MPIDPKSWTQEELRRHSVDRRQFIDFRQSTLANGSRIIEAYNSSGLTFTVLPDRGMDIWTAHYKGIPLTWISQSSPYPPDFGQTWLQQFNGGLLTTCGLTHVGPPEKDDITGEWRDVHGRYSRLRAQDIHVDDSILGGWKEDVDGGQVPHYFRLALQATIHQSALFGEQLMLERMIRMDLTTPEIQISDTLTNLGDKPIPVMMLYHTNFGFPIIQGGTKLYTSFEKVYPRDANAKLGRDTWATYEAASAEYPEQVFYHHLKKASGEHWIGVLLTNEAEDFGISLRWDTLSMPYLSQWKNTRQGMYVCGIEPGTCIPEGLNAARKSNRLRILEPGEELYAEWDLRVLDGADSVKAVKSTILHLQKRGQPLPNCHLEDYAAFAE